MDKEEKINEITKFIISHPESIASLTILKRHYTNNYFFESSQELTLNIKKKLKNENEDEINFCYYLIK